MSFTFTWDVGNPLFQLRSMQLINSLYPWGQYDRIRACVAALPGPPMQADFGPRSGPIPPYVVARDRNIVGVFLTGVTTLEDGLAMLIAGSSEAVSYLGCSFPSVILKGALRIVNLMFEVGVSRADGVILSGHSYGGSLAEVVAFILRRAHGIDNVAVLTFGSPRAGDRSFADALRGVICYRIMCDSDPVPRFPPYQDEAPLAYSVLPGAVTDWWGQWTHPGTGYSLDEGGNLVATPLPPLTHAIADINLLEWAVSPYGFSGARHAGYHYVRRLTQRVKRTMPDAPTSAPQPVLGVPSVSRIHDALPAATVAVGEVVKASLEGVNMAKQVPVELLAKKQKVGTTWCVVWMNQVVAEGTSRSNAGSMAARLNGWLRRLVRVAVINETSLQLALSQFITAGNSSGLFDANGVVISG